MAKYYGVIGFAMLVDDGHGIISEQIEERTYYGDVLKKQYRMSDTPDSINSSLTVNNRISVLMDHFIDSHLQAIRYLTYAGAKWSVSEATVEYPRIILTLGSVYSDEKGCDCEC